MFIKLLGLELRLKVRDVYVLLSPVVFLLGFVLLFPLALTPEQHQLAAFAPGIAWLASLVSIMLHLDRFFREDYEQGTLDILPSAELGIYSLIARILAHWLVIALPLCLLASLLSFAFGITGEKLALLVSSLAIGSVILVCMGATIASLCIGISRASLLIGILLLPLLTPIIIFGVAASQNEANSWQLIILLFGFACINLVISPILCNASLRATID